MMICPQLEQLPEPPRGKQGWPWTQASSVAPMGSVNDLPVITIVTPTFNQRDFIEQTIRSLLLQGYSRLEYFIFDGGSTDGTLEILRKYAPWISYWESLPDRGQTHAVNKGLSRANGSLFNWLNSDDLLQPGVLREVAARWLQFQSDFIAGDAEFVDAVSGKRANYWEFYPPRRYTDFIPPRNPNIPQPATFINIDTIRSLGAFREDLRCVMDYEFYFRAMLRKRGNCSWQRIPRNCATILWHPQSKTSTLQPVFAAEWENVLKSYSKEFTIEGKLLLSWYERQKQWRSKLSNNLPFIDYFRLALKYPEALVKRFFWGAVRRKLTMRIRPTLCGS
jgi:glycosyltransferase involved in cell wall biosynthesis